MLNIIKSFVLSEGIVHLEDLPIADFISVLRRLDEMRITEKLDGANLWVGVDDEGLFYTSREGKTKNKRFYSVDDYAMVAAHNAFRSAHLALEKKQDVIKQILMPGQVVEIEVLFGRQPNTVVYGGQGKNYIAFLRGVEGTSDDIALALSRKLDDEEVTVQSDIISTVTGEELTTTSQTQEWQFVAAREIDAAKLKPEKLNKLLDDLEKWANKSCDFFDMTNAQAIEASLTKIPKAVRPKFKALRDELRQEALDEFKGPIKELILDSAIRSVKSQLAADDLDDSETIGIEGVVLKDPKTDQQVKIVDKTMFTAINTFNNSVRGEISGHVRTDDPNASMLMQGGTYGRAKSRIATVLGNKNLAMGLHAKKIFAGVKGATAIETANNLAKELSVPNFSSCKTKILAILRSTSQQLKDQLQDFKTNHDKIQHELTSGKTVGLSPETVNKTLVSFAETIADVNAKIEQCQHAKTLGELILVLYQFNISKINNDITEGVSFTMRTKTPFINSIYEDDAGGDAAGASTTAGDIASNPQRILPNGKLITRMCRRFKKAYRFAAPTNIAADDVSESFSILMSLDEDAFAPQSQFSTFGTSKDNSTDVDDKAAQTQDVEFKSLRNKIAVAGNVSQQTVSDYLDKAHEINSEVESVTFGLELDDGSVVKVFVNADQADEFEKAMGELLGTEDDVEAAINTLADTYDIVDVLWPTSPQTYTDQPGEELGTDQDQLVDIQLDDPEAPSLELIKSLAGEGELDTSNVDTSSDPDHLDLSDTDGNEEPPSDDPMHLDLSDFEEDETSTDDPDHLDLSDIDGEAETNIEDEPSTDAPEADEDSFDLEDGIDTPDESTEEEEEEDDESKKDKKQTKQSTSKKES